MPDVTLLFFKNLKPPPGKNLDETFLARFHFEGRSRVVRHDDDQRKRKLNRFEQV